MMMPAIPNGPHLLGLFEKRVPGDDALLSLARLYFERAGLGAEIYVTEMKDLEHLLTFCPRPDLPVTVHLSRDKDLLTEQGRDFILEIASRFAGQLYGLVVHDQAEIISHRSAYLQAVEQLALALNKIKNSPGVFIEYAIKMKINFFVDLFDAIRDLEQISACIDIGHIGLYQAAQILSQRHPGKDVYALSPNDQDVVAVIEDIDLAVKAALPAILAVLDALGRLKKSVHIHLHDGHPLIKSDLGVSDHRSFFWDIPIPFQFKGKRTLSAMFGPEGLKKIVHHAGEVIGRAGLSCTLEIHPQGNRLPLEAEAALFHHWEDETNAEIMNAWLSEIIQNQRFIIDQVGIF